MFPQAIALAATWDTSLVARAARAIARETRARGVRQALSPVINPKFPGVPIGQFSPLVGARPFRRPTHSGSLMVSYAKGPADVAVSAFFAGKRDGSTFLDDEFFGYSLLLPNKDLEAGYQKVDLSAGYRPIKHLRAFISIENLFDKDYDASFGFPALGLAARAVAAQPLVAEPGR